jgi:(p)ppGpp synthase/HD superfamily hydrolase
VTWPIEAEALAARLLADRRTSLGGTLLAHAKRVAAGVLDTGDEGLVAVALLHDVIEKAGASSSDLLADTGDERVLRLVEALTQLPGESDYDYLSRCAERPETLLIKRLDLLDKFAAEDSSVTAEVAERVRRRARQRLDLLERLALRYED